MVTAVTNFGRSGLGDWIYQRISSVVLLAYFAYLAFFLASNGDLQYQDWVALFECTGMQIFSALALVSLVAHCWIGLWGISTDYLTERLMGPLGNALRWAVQVGGGLLLFTYLVWGFLILWG